MANSAGQQDQEKRSEVDPDYRNLVQLCEGGMLYEAEEWLEEGHSAKQPESCRHCPLLAATKAGFHSLVRMLLRYDCSPEQKQRAFKWAASEGNFEISKLLVEAGANAGDLSPDYFPSVYQRDFFQYLIDHGLDLTREDALANLFVERRAKPLLGLYLQNKDRFPAWEDQAALALCEFVEKEDLKWISLMIWAGADPLKKVHEFCECPDDCEEDAGRSAVEIAVSSRNPRVFAMLKVHLDPVLATTLLHESYVVPPVETLTALLAAGADLNYFPPEKGTVLHRILNSFGFDGYFQFSRGRARQSVETIALLIREGAKWRPPSAARSIADLRRSLYHQDSEAVVEVIRLLHAGNTCPIEQLVELARTPKMKGWIEKHDSKLAVTLGF
jgi:ankyrin repeat protein